MQGKRVVPSRDTLHTLYVEQRLSASRVGRLLGINCVTVLKYLRHYDIPIRSMFEILSHDLSGKTFGYWKVTKYNSRNSNRNEKKVRWKCLCTLCDKYHWVLASSLYSNVTTKCRPCQEKLHRKGYKELDGTYWRTIKESAKARNLELTITPEYIVGLFRKQKGRCALSGLVIKLAYKGLATASLDRIDSDKGYIEGNVQWVHKDINRMKWAFEQDVFIHYCKSVAKYNRRAKRKDVA